MNFKPFGMGLAALAFLASSFSTQAADIPRPVYKGLRPAVVAYYNWTGFYVGLNAGYGMGTSNWSLPPATSIKPKGALIGGTLGYNYQVGSIVYGIEGDFNWSDVKGESACGVGITCETKSDWLATFRGRVGYAFDRWLPYVTAGGAYGNVKATTTALGGGLSTSASSSQFGWTGGVGLEYAFLGSWTAKIEYLYVDLNNSNFTITGAPNGYRFGLIRAGVNYRF